MLAEPSESDDSVLESVRLRVWKRDTVFAPYDPLTNTPVIPLDVFARRPYLVVLPDPFDTMEVKPSNKTRYEITWDAPSVGGTLELVVTRQQIWLRSGGDNPNPDELFWITDITVKQYKGIELMLDKYRHDFEEVTSEFGFSRHLYWRGHTPELSVPAEWNDETRRVHEGEFKEKMYLNAKNLIEIVNSGLNVGDRLTFPDRSELDQILPVRWESVSAR